VHVLQAVRIFSRQSIIHHRFELSIFACLQV
jgi:hypothetical protein